MPSGPPNSGLAHICDFKAINWTTDLTSPNFKTKKQTHTKKFVEVGQCILFHHLCQMAEQLLSSPHTLSQNKNNNKLHQKTKKKAINSTAAANPTTTIKQTANFFCAAEYIYLISYVSPFSHTGKIGCLISYSGRW